MDTYIQIYIVILGGMAIWLVGRPEKYSRVGYIIGLLSQPGWLYATANAEQWGMFALAIFYTYSWLQGIYFNWIKED